MMGLLHIETPPAVISPLILFHPGYLSAAYNKVAFVRVRIGGVNVVVNMKGVLVEVRNCLGEPEAFRKCDTEVVDLAYSR